MYQIFLPYKFINAMGHLKFQKMLKKNYNVSFVFQWMLDFHMGIKNLKQRKRSFIARIRVTTKVQGCKHDSMSRGFDSVSSNADQI